RVRRVEEGQVRGAGAAARPAAGRPRADRLGRRPRRPGLRKDPHPAHQAARRIARPTLSNTSSNTGYPGGVSTYVPPGWPAQVHPPGTERFEDTVLTWLLEHVPPEYRRYGVLRRYPIALARMARQHIAASVEAAREGFRTARVDLGDVVPPARHRVRPGRLSPRGRPARRAPPRRRARRDRSARPRRTGRSPTSPTFHSEAVTVPLTLCRGVRKPLIRS